MAQDRTWGISSSACAPDKKGEQCFVQKTAAGRGRGRGRSLPGTISGSKPHEMENMMNRNEVRTLNSEHHDQGKANVGRGWRKQRRPDQPIYVPAALRRQKLKESTDKITAGFSDKDLLFSEKEKSERNICTKCENANEKDKSKVSVGDMMQVVSSVDSPIGNHVVQRSDQTCSDPPNSTLTIDPMEEMVDVNAYVCHNNCTETKQSCLVLDKPDLKDTSNEFSKENIKSCAPFSGLDMQDPEHVIGLNAENDHMQKNMENRFEADSDTNHRSTGGISMGGKKCSTTAATSVDGDKISTPLDKISEDVKFDSMDDDEPLAETGEDIKSALTASDEFMKTITRPSDSQIGVPGNYKNIDEQSIGSVHCGGISGAMMEQVVDLRNGTQVECKEGNMRCENTEEKSRNTCHSNVETKNSLTEVTHEFMVISSVESCGVDVRCACALNRPLTSCDCELSMSHCPEEELYMQRDAVECSEKQVNGKPGKLKVDNGAGKGAEVTETYDLKDTLASTNADVENNSKMIEEIKNKVDDCEKVLKKDLPAEENLLAAGDEKKMKKKRSKKKGEDDTGKGKSLKEEKEKKRKKDKRIEERKSEGSDISSKHRSDKEKIKKTSEKTNKLEKEDKNEPSEADGKNCRKEKESTLKQKSGKESSSDDDWERKFDETGECINSELLQEFSHMTRITNPKPCKTQFDYYSFTPKEVNLDEDPAYAHIVEIYDFSSELTTADIAQALTSFHNQGYEIKWTDDTHALAVFSSEITAKQAIQMCSSPLLKLRPVSEGTSKSKGKAKNCLEFLLPYKPRPKTTNLTANRMVTGALGMKSTMTKEQRKKEREKLLEAKEQKKQEKQRKADAWGGDDTP